MRAIDLKQTSVVIVLPARGIVRGKEVETRQVGIDWDCCDPFGYRCWTGRRLDRYGT